jgi:hypothetical protein
MWVEVHGGCVSYIMNFVPRKFDLKREQNLNTFKFVQICIIYIIEKKKEKLENQSKPLERASGSKEPVFLDGIITKKIGTSVMI